MNRMIRKRQNRFLTECRFCLEKDNSKNMISPCVCSGSVAFVHNNCLIKWYIINPDSGIICPICKTDLASETEYPIEEINYFINYSMFIRIDYSVTSIFLWHWIFTMIFFIVHFFYRITLSDYLLLYKNFQIFFHINYLSLLFIIITNIKLKRRYLAMWCTSLRISLIITHGLYFILFRDNLFFGCIADFCCFQYFRHHLDILNELNAKNGMRFITRK